MTRVGYRVGPGPTGSADQELIETAAPGERQLIEAALAQTKGKVSGLSGAAAKLGIPASTLESKIRSLKINKYRFKDTSFALPFCRFFPRIAVN